MRKFFAPGAIQEADIKEPGGDQEQIKQDIGQIRPAIDRQQIEIDPQRHIYKKPGQPQEKGQHDPF